MQLIVALYVFISTADASLVNSHSFGLKENECSVGFKGESAEERCTALLNDSIHDPRTGKNFSFLELAKDFLSKEEPPNDDCTSADCDCEDYKARVKELEDRVKRCETDKTCWPRAKEMLPKVIEHLKADIDKRCPKKDASLVNVHSSEPEENQCTKGFHGATEEERCADLLDYSNDMLKMYLKLENTTKSTSESSFLQVGKEDEECAELRSNLENLEKNQKRCETDKTCWPRAKEMIPKVIEKIKKSMEEKKCD